MSASRLSDNGGASDSSSRPPQLYAIRATGCPVVVVFARRGTWFRIVRWDVSTNDVELGAWFRGRIYQRRCDVSPDGRWLYVFAMKSGKPFHAISRVPWLTALALWHDNTTYGNGLHFEPAKRGSVGTAPDVGTVEPLANKYGLGLVANEIAAYGVERRRGWREHPQAPPRTNDPWDEKRHQWLVCDQPGGNAQLELRDAGYARGHLEGRAPTYTLDGKALPDVTWADWDMRGRLLVATRHGALEIRDAATQVLASKSLADGFDPDPQAPPSSARHW